MFATYITQDYSVIDIIKGLSNEVSNKAFKSSNKGSVLCDQHKTFEISRQLRQRVHGPLWSYVGRVKITSICEQFMLRHTLKLTVLIDALLCSQKRHDDSNHGQLCSVWDSLLRWASKKHQHSALHYQGNPPVTAEFCSHRAGNAQSIPYMLSWRWLMLLLKDKLVRWKLFIWRASME